MYFRNGIKILIIKNLINISNFSYITSLYLFSVQIILIMFKIQ